MVSMGTELKIDPELEAVCLPLSDEEFDLLEKQVIRDGCQDALKVWDRDGELILLDGHNRLKICKKHKLPYDTSTIEIASIDEAVIWIVDNQKGRRNVATKEQQDYISGKRYEAQKNINKFKGNQYTKESGSCDSCSNQTGGGRTAAKQSKEIGEPHERTIYDNAKFAQGVDAVREVSPELAEKILKPSGDAPRLTKSTVAAIPKLKKKLANEPEKFVEAVQEIHDALETKDKTTIAKVVRDHVTPDEPTHEEKMIAKKHHLMPEHVRYANEHHIPIEKLKTVEQIDATNPRTPKTCSAIWDGFYECSCGIQFEIFRSVHAPACCPHCGKPDNLKRSRGV